MPTYSFINKETGEITEHFMSISALDEFKARNPHLDRYMGDATPSVIDPTRLGRVKVDNGFREVLGRIAERTPGGRGLKDSIR
jgi:hypothetical protein